MVCVCSDPKVVQFLQSWAGVLVQVGYQTDRVAM